MPSPFDVRVTEEAQLTLLSLVGELDLAAAPTLQGHLLDLERAGATHVVVDLRGLTFMDSSGLRVLIMAHRRTQEGGRRFTVVRGSGHSNRLMLLTRADEALDVIESLQGISMTGD